MSTKEKHWWMWVFVCVPVLQLENTWGMFCFFIGEEEEMTQFLSILSIPEVSFSLPKILDQIEIVSEWSSASAYPWILGNSLNLMINQLVLHRASNCRENFSTYLAILEEIRSSSTWVGIPLACWYLLLRWIWSIDWSWNIAPRKRPDWVMTDVSFVVNPTSRRSI